MLWRNRGQNSAFHEKKTITSETSAMSKAPDKQEQAPPKSFKEAWKRGVDEGSAMAMSKAFHVLFLLAIAILCVYLLALEEDVGMRFFWGMVFCAVFIADGARLFWPWAKRHPIISFFLACFLAFLAVLAIEIVAPQLLDEIQAELNRGAAL